MLLALADMERQGLEGTVLGTLIMPYGSGAPNLIFAAVMALQVGGGREVLVNGLVNNATNLSLLIALPGLIWGLEFTIRGRSTKKARREQSVHRISVCLSLIAALFFTGMVLALGLDGQLSRGDGAVMVGTFIFWQVLEVLNLMRHNVEKGKAIGKRIPLDLIVVVIGGALMFRTVDGLVQWLSTRESGWLSLRYVGWLSGWLMVVPNAVPAFYYGAKRRADVVYSSQVGDGHICIPLCIGLFALISPVATPAFLLPAVALICGMAFLHVVVVGVMGRLPRVLSAILIAGYIAFVVYGLRGT